jgi:hypothetical protein
VNWSQEKSFPQEFIYYETGTVRARNGLVYNNQNTFSAPQSAPQKFYRTTTYVPSLAACINNLAEIRFAKEVWTLENKKIGLGTPTQQDIAAYLKPSGPACPLDAGGSFQSSYIVSEIVANPRCMISTDHILEEPEY